MISIIDLFSLKPHCAPLAGCPPFPSNYSGGYRSGEACKRVPRERCHESYHPPSDPLSCATLSSWRICTLVLRYAPIPPNGEHTGVGRLQYIYRSRLPERYSTKINVSSSTRSSSNLTAFRFDMLFLHLKDRRYIIKRYARGPLFVPGAICLVLRKVRNHCTHTSGFRVLN